MTWSGLLREEVAELSIQCFMFCHLGVADIMKNIGCREPVALKPANIRCVAGLPAYDSHDYSCLESATLNAVAIVRGPDAQVRFD